MSQQPLDLRKSLQILKRFKVVMGIAAGLGLLVGIGYTVLNPPESSSSAIVSFPTSVHSTATQVVIADSYPVLSAASARLSPPVPVDQLRGEVTAASLTTYLISITATSKSAGQAEATANAVAESYVAYVGNKQNPVAHVDARLFQPAITAAAPSLLGSMLLTGLIGLLGGALVGSIVALAIGRKDKRLRERDQIANAIAVPVVASVPVGHPTAPAGWTKLLESYQPQAVHAWQLRTVLRYLGIVDQTYEPPADQARQSKVNGARGANGNHGGVSVTVVSLAPDTAALALGPQLAVFAASHGIPTALVIGPQQDDDAVAGLRTACAASPPPAGWPALLRTVVSDGMRAVEGTGAVLTVVPVVVDDRTPKIRATVRTAATVIGVSSGRVTAEQLARAAVAAEADGRDVTGVLVADPQPEDKTTGRVPNLMHPPRRMLPNRLNGVVREGTR